MGPKRIAAYLLTDYLERLGVEVVFGLCGHTVIAMLDALGKSKIRFVSTRHEQVAAHAADGYARATGKPGVVLLHLGPGLTNGVTGVANAALDSIPMVVIAGDAQSYFQGRHPHQEFNLHQDADQFQIYRPFCKRVYRVDRVEDLPRIMERAFHLAVSGRPGPVLVDVPMDIFSADLAADAFAKAPAPVVQPTLDPADASRIVEALAKAERPVIYAGGGVISARATAELAALVEALDIPVVHSLMGKGCLPDAHPLLLGQTGFWGLPIANEMCRTADLILAVGTRLAEANSSSWDPEFTFSIPPTRLMHIDVDAAEIGRNYQTELGVVADARIALGALAQAAKGVKRARSRIIARAHRRRTEGFLEAWAGQWTSDPVPDAPRANPARITGRRPAGRIHRHRRRLEQERCRAAVPDHSAGTFVTPSGLATMGFGPAAVLGVKLAHPNRAAVSLVGDGGFSANPSVVATAMEADLPVVWVVMDNAGFGTIAGLEDMHYDTNFGTMFTRRGQPYRVDYAAMARSCGARGIAIEHADDSALRYARPWHPTSRP